MSTGSGMSRALGLARNLFALLGLVLLVASVTIYSKGCTATRQLDPRATLVLGEFGRKVLDGEPGAAMVVKMPLDEGVSIADAVESMKLRANQRNIKLVGRFALHKEFAARSEEEYPYVEVFQFCDPDVAMRLLRGHPDFVAHMPCRIALYQDQAGRGWLVALNLDLVIHGGRALPPEVRREAIAIKDGLLDIMVAGAAGDL